MTTDTPKQNWFKQHPTIAFFMGLFLFVTITSAFDNGDTNLQEAEIYNPIIQSAPSILTTPTPYVPTYQAPSNYNSGSGYKYNSRSGYSGDYEYNYDIEGYGGEDGGYYYGDIDISQDGGEGYIYDEDGNEVWIEGEWDGYGEIEAYDENGNYYELEVD